MLCSGIGLILCDILFALLKKNNNLTQEDVRSIVKDELIDMGLDQVPKKLNLLDKILVSIDKLVSEKTLNLQPSSDFT